MFKLSPAINFCNCQKVFSYNVHWKGCEKIKFDKLESCEELDCFMNYAIAMQGARRLEWRMVMFHFMDYNRSRVCGVSID